MWELGWTAVLPSVLHLAVVTAAIALVVVRGAVGTRWGRLGLAGLALSGLANLAGLTLTANALAGSYVRHYAGMALLGTVGSLLGFAGFVLVVVALLSDRPARPAPDGAALSPAAGDPTG